MYEKLGFSKFEHLPNFYHIDQKAYSAYAMGKFYNGGMKKLGWGEWIRSFWQDWILQLFQVLLKRLLPSICSRWLFYIVNLKISDSNNERNGTNFEWPSHIFFILCFKVSFFVDIDKLSYILLANTCWMDYKSMFEDLLAEPRTPIKRS